MRVRWTTPALRDLEAIGEYIERDNSVAAARVIAAIFRQTDDLAKFPHMGRPGRIPGTRELVVVDAPFIAPYRVRDEEVEILAVLHASRRWPEDFG